jgi:D-sedoheptulose 7-phosphate isomerase
MDSYPTIAASFGEAIDLVSTSVDPLAPGIEQAARLCIDALLQERKIITCGVGGGAAVAQIFCTSLLHRFEHERPALPAIALGADGMTLSALAATSSNDLYSKQVRALGQPGDVLLAIAGDENNGSIVRAVQAAHDRELPTIVLSGGNSADVSSLLLPEDVELHVASARTPRIIEVQVMIIHCLCQLIDESLFGSYQS